MPSMNGHSVNLFRSNIAVACVAIPFIVNAAEWLTANSKQGRFGATRRKPFGSILTP